MVKVSIIIPVYKVESYINDCLSSLENQTYSDLELIFVDDCGTDGSIAIIEEFISSHPLVNARIQHHENNRGLSAARNTGLIESSGDYVYFYDSDDKIPADAIEKLLEPLSDKDYDVVIGGYDVFGDELLPSDLAIGRGALEGEEVLNSYADGKWYVMAWNKLCRRQFLLDNQLFFEEGYIHEDQIWSFKVACKASSVYVVPDVTYEYRVRKSSIMTGMGIQKDAQTYVRVYEVISNFIKEEHLESNPRVYSLFEGKRSGILYSLLEKEEYAVFDSTYRAFYQQNYICPLKSKGIVNTKELIRDLHYALPVSLGVIYKRVFYFLYYKARRKPIVGAVWR